MKKFISLLFIFLFLSLSISKVNVLAEPKTLTQGIYNARDTNLLIGTPITVKITPASSKIIIMVVDSNQIMQTLVRLNPQIPQQILPPLDYDDHVVILGSGAVTFS